MQVVEKDSDVIGNRFEKEYLMHGDHRSMIKFSSRQDPGYKSIVHIIRIILKQRVETQADCTITLTIPRPV